LVAAFPKASSAATEKVAAAPAFTGGVNPETT
jgi:hypothetical protein